MFSFIFSSKYDSFQISTWLLGDGNAVCGLSAIIGGFAVTTLTNANLPTGVNGIAPQTGVTMTDDGMSGPNSAYLSSIQCLLSACLLFD